MRGSAFFSRPGAKKTAGKREKLGVGGGQGIIFLAYPIVSTIYRGIGEGKGKGRFRRKLSGG